MIAGALRLHGELQEGEDAGRRTAKQILAAAGMLRTKGYAAGALSVESFRDALCDPAALRDLTKTPRWCESVEGFLDGMILRLVATGAGGDAGGALDGVDGEYLEHVVGGVMRTHEAEMNAACGVAFLSAAAEAGTPVDEALVRGRLSMLLEEPARLNQLPAEGTSGPFLTLRPVPMISPAATAPTSAGPGARNVFSLF